MWLCLRRGCRIRHDSTGGQGSGRRNGNENRICETSWEPSVDQVIRLWGDVTAGRGFRREERCASKSSRIRNVMGRDGERLSRAEGPKTQKSRVEVSSEYERRCWEHAYTLLVSSHLVN